MCKLGRKKKLIDEDLLLKNKSKEKTLDKGKETKEESQELSTEPEIFEDEKGKDIPVDENIWGNDAKRLWGTLIMKLREKNLMTLHSACGEIKDLNLRDSHLRVSIKDKLIYDILTKEENKEKILSILKEIDSRIQVQFIKKKVPYDVSLKNMETLRKLFGDEVRIK